jgi:hypothetical protein
MTSSGVGPIILWKLWVAKWGDTLEGPSDDAFRKKLLATEAAQTLVQEPFTLVRDAIRESDSLDDAVAWIATTLAGGGRAVTCRHGNPPGSCAECKAPAKRTRAQPAAAHRLGQLPARTIAKGGM